MKRISFLIVAMALAAILVACAGPAEETPTPDMALDFVPVVAVTGEVVPETWATVGAQTGGTVLEVVVEPGDEVAEGDLLIRLDSTDAQLAVQQAEAALQAAEAQLALLQAGARPEEVAAAEAQVAAAQAALAQAAAQRNQLTGGATEAEVAAAQAALAAAQAEQWMAREAHDQTMECFDMPDGSEVCPGLGPMEEQARYALHAANEALAAAQAQLDALLAGADDQARTAEAAVWAASAQEDIAQAQLSLLQAGVTAEQVAVAEAAVAQAQVALEAAGGALERSEIRAPLAGTVGAVYARAGELVVLGQPLVILGDLAGLQVETTDLDEIDVARVAVGQSVALTFDALPQRVFEGTVARISPMAEPSAGGVHYTAIIALSEIDPAIRWGMTAFVDIEVDGN